MQASASLAIRIAALLPECTGWLIVSKMPPEYPQPLVLSSKLGFCNRLFKYSAWRILVIEHITSIRMIRIAIRELFNSAVTFLEDAHILAVLGN
jgi:hypothetical protein